MTTIYCDLTAYAPSPDSTPINYDGTFIWILFPGASEPLKVRPVKLPGINLTSISPGTYKARVTYDETKPVIIKDPATEYSGFTKVELVCNTTVPLEVDEANYGIINQNKAATGDVVVGGTRLGVNGILFGALSVGAAGVVANIVGPSTGRNYGGVFQKNPLSFLPSFAFLPLPNYLPSLTIFNQVAGLTSMAKDTIAALKDITKST